MTARSSTPSGLLGQALQTVPSPGPRRPLLRVVVLAILTGLTASFAETGLAANAPEGAAQARFILVLDGLAVQDTTTGLVWEQSPDRDFDGWAGSIERCRTKTVGGREGWRAPTIDELKTLIDPSRKDPALPEDHPFSNIKSAIFWAATPVPGDDVVAWQVSFFSGLAQTDQKSLPRRVWCVLEQQR